MSQFGRGAKATSAQRAEVERLATEGVSVRRIAALVFGDARFRGRVERILRRPAGVEPLPGAIPLPEGVDPSQLSLVELFRLLLGRRLVYLAESGKAPSASELRALLDLSRRLESLEQLERIRGQQPE
jgi:hypothetical protein